MVTDMSGAAETQEPFDVGAAVQPGATGVHAAFSGG
jgi:hypothetical protein